MDLEDAKAYLSVIQDEQERRAAVRREQDPEYAGEDWVCVDLPFIAELCLVFLVSLRHHVERRLLYFAACATEDGLPITKAEYEKRRQSTTSADEQALGNN